MRLAIIGSNDLGKLIAHHSKIDKGWEIAGFLDNKKPKGTIIESFGEVIGSIDDSISLYKENRFDKLMIGVGYTQFSYRKEVFEKFDGLIPFANLIHSTSYVDPSAKLGQGIFLLPGVTIDMNVTIEDNVLINTACKVAHDSKIGRHSFLGPGVTLAGNVNIIECNFIGVGAVISDNVVIAAKSLIGAGAVVTNSITVSGTYLGIPAKRLHDNKYWPI